MVVEISIQGTERLRTALARLRDQYGREVQVRVGVLEGATNTAGENIAEYAAKNEFGSREDNTPPRPFMRWTVQHYSRDWAAGAASLLEQERSPQEVMALLGEQAKGSIKRVIADWQTPPNSVATQERKGFNKPLVDTGDMLNSIDYEVKS